MMKEKGSFSAEKLASVKVKSFSYAYGYRKLFENVSFEVCTGECLQIVGANGCGKTTLLQILCGLKKSQQGQLTAVTLETQNTISSLRDHQSYLDAEHNGHFAFMGAKQNLSFWARLRMASYDEKSLTKVLQRVGISHLLARRSFPVAKLSTGLKRRLSLARLLIEQAPLWVLDEPSFGLDAPGIQMLEKMAQEHCERGGIILFVSHDSSLLGDLTSQKVTLSSKHSS